MRSLYYYDNFVKKSVYIYIYHFVGLLKSLVYFQFQIEIFEEQYKM